MFNTAKTIPKYLNKSIISRCLHNKSNINIFIRNAITQLKTEEEINKTENVINSIKQITQLNLHTKKPIFLNNTLNANTQNKNIDIKYTPKAFRKERLDMVSKADIFVFLYDQNALSVSGGVELGYWLHNEIENKNKHTVVILMNTIETTLLKMLPNTTYIQLDDSNKLDVKHFPNLIKINNLDELPIVFKNLILNKYCSYFNEYYGNSFNSNGLFFL